MSQKTTIPNVSPSVTELSQAVASVDDWRAILIFACFFVIVLMGFVIWREFNLRSLTKAIDKITDALWSLRLSIAEDRVLARETSAREAALRKEERAVAREDRALSAEERQAARDSRA